MGVSYPVFSEDDVEATTANSVTVKKSAFNDYLNFVSYNGTIDDVKIMRVKIRLMAVR